MTPMYQNLPMRHLCLMQALDRLVETYSKQDHGSGRLSYEETRTLLRIVATAHEEADADA